MRAAQLRLIDPDRNAILAGARGSNPCDVAAAVTGRTLLGHHLELRRQDAPPVLWDLEHHRLNAQLDSHIGRVFSARFVAGGEILTAGGDGTARRWEGTTGRLRQTYRGSSRFLADAALDPGGSLVVGGDASGILRFWDASSGKLLWTLPTHKSY